MDVDVALARRLVAKQFPELTSLPIQAVESQGSDNRTFRLGAWLKLRFPRAAAYEAQVRKEARWLPVLEHGLHVEIPQVVAVNPPTNLYPFDWALQSWIDGKPASIDTGRDPLFAHDVARFLRALWAIDAADGPPAGVHSFHRGGSLGIYDAEMRASADALRSEAAIVDALNLWDAALKSGWEPAPVWVHGDVAAGNLLVDESGQLNGVIDFGCMAVGDPACDLVVAWTMFEGEARASFVRAVEVDDSTWARARGWALWKAMITLASARENAAARRVIAEVLG